MRRFSVAACSGRFPIVNLDLKSESPDSANYNCQKRFALLFINSELLMNNSKPSKSSNCSSMGRERGIVLSPQGWQRFQVAKQQAESAQIWGKHLTQEDLSERTGLSLNTLYRVLKRELGVDRQSLEYLFGAFGLELTKADHLAAIATGGESDRRGANSHQDWDSAVDTSVFYGRERELAQLWQWIVCNRCSMAI
jgi:transcriptional regulator with XRE-family HTH domain